MCTLTSEQCPVTCVAPRARSATHDRTRESNWLQTLLNLGPSETLCRPFWVSLSPSTRSVAHAGCVGRCPDQGAGSPAGLHVALCGAVGRRACQKCGLET